MSKSTCILLAGPVKKRIDEFVPYFVSGLGKENCAVVSLQDFMHQSPVACMFDKESVDLKKLTTHLSTRTEPVVCIVGESAMCIEALRDMSKVKLFFDADQFLLATDHLEKYKTDPQILQRFKKQEELEEQQKPEKTFEAENESDWEYVSRKMTEKIEACIFPSMQFADIIIRHDEQADETSAGLVRYIKRTCLNSGDAGLKKGDERAKQIDEMLNRYENTKSYQRKARWKRFLWKSLIKSTLVFKRLIDIILSLTALILLSPVFLIVAIIIKLTDGGSVFYVQTRVGKQGKEFPFPKFRSMVKDADKLKDTLLKESERVGDVTFKMKKDPRVTKIGRFIRRFSIDELPQIWCVLKGDMSLVGPRPPVPREVKLYTQEDRRRLEVTPGLTGIWQVSGRADIAFEQQVELDVLYIESHGIWLDIKLILKTIPAVFLGKGAY